MAASTPRSAAGDDEEPARRQGWRRTMVADLARRAVRLARAGQVEAWPDALRSVHARPTRPRDAALSTLASGLMAAVSRLGWRHDPEMPALGAVFCSRTDGQSSAGYRRFALRQRQQGRDIAVLWHAEVSRLHAWARRPGAADALLQWLSPVPSTMPSFAV